LKKLLEDTDNHSITEETEINLKHNSS